MIKFLLAGTFAMIANLSASAQFTHAEIKVHGLTCSLCSRSVEMALRKVDFVKDVNTDLQTTTTTITFKEGVTVFPELLAEAVDKSGFSVGYVKMGYTFKNTFSGCYEDENVAFTFLEDDKEYASGTKDIIFVEKDMMNNKMFKDYKDKLPSQCAINKRHYYVAMADNMVLN